MKTDKQNKQIVGTGAEAESLMNNLENTSPDLNKQTENLKKSMDTGY
ncbi:MAG: hypothetical protein JXL67_09905 [Calditrichaeota bacterium]|nr:hypothetical protein [Calditrichota bacterium]